MASVQHLFCDAELIGEDIIKKASILLGVERERLYAVLKIQRQWRGYAVRKMVKRWHNAATTIQTCFRGWVVRWHLPETYQAYLDRICLEHYNRMATRIQAAWRGYKVRKVQPNIKKLVTQKELARQNLEENQRLLQEAFAKAKETLAKAQSAPQRAQLTPEEALRRVIFILFKSHHLLRTRQIEGVFSIHGTSELSLIEQLIKAIPLQDYMLLIRKVYSGCVEQLESPKPYFFTKISDRNIEDAYRKRCKSNDIKEVPIIDKNIHEKPFQLTSKIERKPYERLALYQEKYTPPAIELGRNLDKSRQISKSDFKLQMLKGRPCESKLMPYYIDFWTKRKCCPVHDVANLFQF